MVKPLQPGVRLTAIFDSCHSGSALDLPYIYSTHGILKEPNLAKEAGQGLLGAISSYSKGDIGGVIGNVAGFFKKATGGDDAYQKTIATKTSPADVIMWSGCKDEQTSSVKPVVSRYMTNNFPEPTHLSICKTLAQCRMLSSRLLKRTRSRATFSSSIAFVTNWLLSTLKSRN